MSELPSGTLTVLHTDIENSTTLARSLREQYPAVLETHRTLLRAAFFLLRANVPDIYSSIPSERCRNAGDVLAFFGVSRWSSHATQTTWPTQQRRSSLVSGASASPHDYVPGSLASARHAKWAEADT